MDQRRGRVERGVPDRAAVGLDRPRPKGWHVSEVYGATWPRRLDLLSTDCLDTVKGTIRQAQERGHEQDQRRFQHRQPERASLGQDLRDHRRRAAGPVRDPAPDRQWHGRSRVILSPRLQRAALVAHITTSIGWLGAIASFLALAAAGLASTDPTVVRAAYVGMDLITWSVIVPLGLASPLTGLVS